MEKDKISIIIPVYNVKNYIKKCVYSIFRQTYRNLEIILVDDGSEDGSSEICDELAEEDSRVFVVHKRNGGLSSARNKGLEAASGECIGFVDSDDYIREDMYEKLYLALSKSGSDLAVCSYQYVDEAGAEIPKESPMTEEILDKDGAYRKLVSDKSDYYVTAVNKLYKKEIFAEIRFPEGKLHEDEFTIHYIFSRCDKIVCISDSLYYYVQRNGSIMNSEYSVKRLYAVEAFLERCHFFMETGKKDYAAKTLRRCYGTLVYAMSRLDVAAYKREFRGFLRLLFPLMTVHGDVRIIKLLLIYSSKIVHDRMSFIKFKMEFFFDRLKTDKNGPAVYLMSTPNHGNLGDQAIVFAERRFLEEAGCHNRIIEIRNCDYLRRKEYISRKIKREDIIVIDGGGNLGTLWPGEDDKIGDIIERFQSNRILVFPQTCCYEESFSAERRLEKNRKIYENAERLTLMLRDAFSYQFAKTYFRGTECILVPDIVLSLNHLFFHTKRSEVLLCFRSDLEQASDSNLQESIKAQLRKGKIPYKETSTVIQKIITRKNRKEELEKKWMEFASARLVITDRLHGMIFSAITGTPCIALDNKSKKVSGSYEWLKGLQYVLFAESPEEVTGNLEKMYALGEQAYTFEYPKQILSRLLKKEL